MRNQENLNLFLICFKLYLTVTVDGHPENAGLFDDFDIGFSKDYDFAASNSKLDFLSDVTTSTPSTSDIDDVTKINFNSFSTISNRNQTNQQPRTHPILSQVNAYKFTNQMWSNIILEVEHKLKLRAYLQKNDEKFKEVDDKIEKLTAYFNATESKIEELVEKTTESKIEELVEKIKDKLSKTNTKINDGFTKMNDNLTTFRVNEFEKLSKEVRSNKAQRKAEVSNSRKQTDDATEMLNKQGKMLLDLVKQVAPAG